MSKCLYRFGFLISTTSKLKYDLYDKKIIAYSLNEDNSVNDPSDNEQANQTTLLTLKMAVKNRNIEKGLIVHSDRGVQYASKKFVNVLSSY